MEQKIYKNLPIPFKCRGEGCRYFTVWSTSRQTGTNQSIKRLEQNRKPGSAKGKITIRESFFDPLPDDIKHEFIHQGLY